MGAIMRGLRNPGRNLARSVLVILFLSVIVGILVIMVQAAALTRQQLNQLEARVRTLIELREAGAFGTGGFGGDKPMGEEAFSVATLEKVKAIPHARYLARIDEYVYTPQIDPSKPNAYAMIIGLRPGAELRAIGEVDYEHAQIIAGRGLQEEDNDQPVAIIGRLYALQRTNLQPPSSLPPALKVATGEGSEEALANFSIRLNGTLFRVVGIYSTGNDFGDNHVFIPLEPFRHTFQPGDKLSKIFITVDSVHHVDTVVEELRAIPEADVVTAPEAVSIAKTTLRAIALTSLYGSLVLFMAGGVLVAFVMVLSTRERVREIGVLKAIGAADSELVGQFVAEALALTLVAAVGAWAVGVLAQRLVQQTLGLIIHLDSRAFLLILGSSLVFAVIGSLYPIIHAIRLTPVEAMRDE